MPIIPFTKKQIEDCKNARTSQWYSKLKRITRHDQHLQESFDVEELAGISREEQGKAILDSILKLINSYEPLKSENIKVS